MLNRQVEDVTSGAIPKKAIGLAPRWAWRSPSGWPCWVCLGIPIYYLLVPGHAAAR